MGCVGRGRRLLDTHGHGYRCRGPAGAAGCVEKDREKKKDREEEEDILVFSLILSTRRSCFAKQSIKTAAAPLRELFVELKLKKWLH